MAGGFTTNTSIAYSGGKDSRPQLDRLMVDARRRRFDVLGIWKFDRFAPISFSSTAGPGEFRSLGIEFVSLSEQIDTSSPAGKLVFTILGGVAELERSLIGERVRAGLRNAKAKGQRLGRPPLKELSVDEIRRLRGERRHSRISFKALFREIRSFGVDCVPDMQGSQGLEINDFLRSSTRS